MRDETIAHRSDLRENQTSLRAAWLPMTLLRGRYSANGLEGLASQLAMLDVAAALFRWADVHARPSPSASLSHLVLAVHRRCGAGTVCTPRRLESCACWPHGCAWRSVLREPDSFIALQLRPRPRNVKLTLFSDRKARIGWCH
jgi:hypothetical protein